MTFEFTWTARYVLAVNLPSIRIPSVVHKRTMQAALSVRPRSLKTSQLGLLRGSSGGVASAFGEEVGVSRGQQVRIFVNGGQGTGCAQ